MVVLFSGSDDGELLKHRLPVVLENAVRLVVEVLFPVQSGVTHVHHFRLDTEFTRRQCVIVAGI
jgi:hypothetical protein